MEILIRIALFIYGMPTATIVSIFVFVIPVLVVIGISESLHVYSKDIKNRPKTKNKLKIIFRNIIDYFVFITGVIFMFLSMYGLELYLMIVISKECFLELFLIATAINVTILIIFLIYKLLKFINTGDIDDTIKYN